MPPVSFLAAPHSAETEARRDRLLEAPVCDDDHPWLRHAAGECYAAYSMKGAPPRAKRWEKKLGMRVDARIAGKTIGSGRAAANWKEQNNATDGQLSAEIKKAQQLSDEVNNPAMEVAEEAKRVELAANPPRATALERKIGVRINLKVGGKTFGSGAAVDEWYKYNPDKDLLEAIETAQSAAQAAEEEAAAAAATVKAQREAAREMAGSAAAQAQRVAEEKAKEREELAKEAAKAAKAALAEAQAAHREWKTEAEKEHAAALAEAERELQEKTSELKARASQQDAEDEEEAEIAAEAAELAAAGKALAASMAMPQASGLEKKLGMRIDLGGLGTGGAYQEWRKEWSNTLDEKKQSPQSSFERTKSAIPEASALEKKLGMRVDLPGVGTGGAYNSWKREEEKKMSPGSSFERTRSMISGPANPMNEGHGKYVYASGDVYEGQFHDNLPHGIGKYTFVSGNVYDGEWKENQKHGKAKFTFADGEVDIKCYEENRPVGEGARWSTDRMQAWELQDGKPGSSISLDEAAAIAGRIGLAVPA